MQPEGTSDPTKGEAESGPPSRLALAAEQREPSSSRRPVSCCNSHLPASAAALSQLGFWLRRLGSGALRFMVAIERKSRKLSAIAGNRPAASAASRLPCL